MSQSTKSRWAATTEGGAQPGPIAVVVRWLLGLIFTVVMVALAVVVVLGAFAHSPTVGFVTLLVVAVIAYFVIREKQ